MEGAEHRVVVVDTGLEITNQVEFQHIYGVASVRLGVVNFHPLRAAEWFSHVDQHGRPRSWLTVAIDHQAISVEFSTAITPVRLECRRGRVRAARKTHQNQGRQ